MQRIDERPLPVTLSSPFVFIRSCLFMQEFMIKRFQIRVWAGCRVRTRSRAARRTVAPSSRRSAQIHHHARAVNQESPQPHCNGRQSRLAYARGKLDRQKVPWKFENLDALVGALVDRRVEALLLLEHLRETDDHS